MARPQKNNLDYFSHDKFMRNDIKIRNLRRKFSHKGYSVYVMMLEHLAECEYLQYKWNDLSIELLVPDFDIDAEELVEIINHCIKLELFQLDEGYLFSTKFFERNSDILNGRKSFDLNNSPIMQLKRNKLPDNPVNSDLTIVNREKVHKEKESKVQDSIGKESKVQESTEQESKLKHKEEILKQLSLVFPIFNLRKKLDTNDLDSIQRYNPTEFENNVSLINAYQSIKI